MSAHQRHRGKHANDDKLFHSDQLPILNTAVADLSWLLSRAYGENSSLKLVGDRYRLTKRQRKALLRASCSDQQQQYRTDTALTPVALQGTRVAIDGYNLLITIEVALSRGYILHCRDGAYRDIASVHSTYRKVEETLPALALIGETLKSLHIQKAHWYLDAPISNSGRLKGIMAQLAIEHDFNWEVELVNNPDKALVSDESCIPISSDSWIIDHAKGWFNLHKYIVQHIFQAEVIVLNGESLPE